MIICCYGDSNTFGYDPRGYFGGRYDAPWPELLGERIGWDVRNNGMNGRRIPRNTVVFPKNADCIAVMLGTNDLLQGLSAEDTAERMGAFLRTLDPKKVLLIAPPPFVPGEWVPNRELIDASRELAVRYEALGFRFLDSGKWDIPMAYDGVHFTEEGHRRFAQALRKELDHA